MELIRVKAPARICLFGDHQDYLGLPVIACAIDRYITIVGRPNKTARFNINLKDLGGTRIINIDNKFDTLQPRDYYGSSLRVLRRLGIVPTCGYDITVRGSIPINAGISSSSALTVAWISFLLKAFGDLSAYTAKQLGHLAYLAESVEHNESGGKMDQYTSAVGGSILIETDKDKTLEKLDLQLPCLLICESGDKKDTLGGLANLNSQANEAIKILTNLNPLFDIKLAKTATIPATILKLPKRLHAIYEAAVKNHQITQEATNLIKSGTPDYKTLGQLISDHHLVLKELLKITTPKIDRIVDAAIGAGALGAKIIGSGGGGCVCILCEDSKKDAILEVLNDQINAKSYEVFISDGAHTLNL